MQAQENLRGILAMLLAVALFSVMDAQLKLLAGHYGPMQVAFLRGAASLPFVLLPVLLRGRLARLRPVNVRLHLLRGALSSTGGSVRSGGGALRLGAPPPASAPPCRTGA